MRVLFSANAPSPYTTEFFNDLGKLCDLTVVYERRYNRDRLKAWQDSVQSASYRKLFPVGIKIGNETGFNPSVIKNLSAKKYDVFVVGNYSSPTGMLMILFMRFRKIPFLIYADGGMAKSDSRIKFALKKFFISKASAWISSGSVTDHYLTHYGADQSRIYWHPFTSLREECIEKEPSSTSEKQELRNRLGINEKKVVLSVGRFIHVKGYDVLLRASAKLGKDTGVYIIGGSPSEEYLELQRQLSLENIRFVGHVSANELKEYFRAADLFVLPTRGEAWGLVINEAMANGLPVITTDKCVAGLELVEDFDNGFIIPVDDVEVLAEKMCAVLEDDVLREKMALESIRIIQPYSIEGMAKAHYEIFTDYLAYT